VRRRSLPLIEIVKQMNIYSNNFMAESLGRQVGGPAVIIGRIAQVTGLPRSELRPINGSGLDVANRWSARSIATILLSLAVQLQYPKSPAAAQTLPPRYSLADLLPVSGRDLGTLAHRTIPLGTAIKTGSLASVSALAGVLPTRDRGLITFAIINGGTNILALRHEQDRFLADLEAIYGQADRDHLPPDLQARAPHLGADRASELKAELYPDQATSLPSLGDPGRNEFAPTEPPADR
jgi:D-alanyl-D-alanine carboxypeptidase/D-alanyl-D-alanine-endopeptidase (penicillin-binding protein 4)